MKVKNSVFLITGGTGSFGHAVVRRLIHEGAKEIRIFSRDEKKQDDMRKEFKLDQLKFYLGDVRDPQSIKNAIHGVDYVFHAAALKQVPSAEFFPLEAVKTNVLGTENVLEASINAGVKKVICLSTDKAAYPINAMGISKAMMERVAIAKSRTVDKSQTTICVTRYGNVMASRGSVIPLFIDQIKSNQPLTITDPSMTRFLMSLEEAVDLVLYAFEHGEPGDLFVQKSPAATIGDVAKALLQLFNSNVKPRVIGPRHAEKLYETLLTKEERLVSQDLGSYFRVPADNRDLNYGKYFEQGQQQINDVQEYTSSNTKQLSIDDVVALLRQNDFVKDALKE
jgi:UDP-N-acetylglucosamine 4,6-dehydratase/5-epimerase